MIYNIILPKITTNKAKYEDCENISTMYCDLDSKTEKIAILQKICTSRHTLPNDLKSIYTV